MSGEYSNHKILICDDKEVHEVIELALEEGFDEYHETRPKSVYSGEEPRGS